MAASLHQIPRWRHHFLFSSWCPSMLQLWSPNTGHLHSCSLPVRLWENYGKHVLRWLSANPTSLHLSSPGPPDPDYVPPLPDWQVRSQYPRSECPSEEDRHFLLFPMWMWTSWPNPRPHPLVLPRMCWEISQQMWLHSADLVTKLWGSAEDLHKMAGFAASTELKIQPAWLSISEEKAFQNFLIIFPPFGCYWNSLQSSL